ncbi:HTH_Tnp_Tc3_2 domain-containing protein [Trichonephila clavipes]|nr:HTH_Tnp_Tc3_2 domain-containing protein [Trichonephila clavipes]
MPGIIDSHDMGLRTVLQSRYPKRNAFQRLKGTAVIERLKIATEEKDYFPQPHGPTEREAKNLFLIISVLTAGRLKRQHRSSLDLDLFSPRVELPFPDEPLSSRKSSDTPLSFIVYLTLVTSFCSPLSENQRLRGGFPVPFRAMEQNANDVVRDSKNIIRLLLLQTWEPRINDTVVATPLLECLLTGALGNTSSRTRGRRVMSSSLVLGVRHRSQRRHGGGRVRSTTPAEDRYIVLSAKRNTRTTAQQVANQFLAASGKQISRKTVARRLRGGGLYARRPVVCIPLTRQHRTARLQWCREHHNWTEQDWASVLFSDESRFRLSSDCRRQLIWRESGTAYRPENIQKRTDIRHAVSWCGPAS